MIQIAEMIEKAKAEGYDETNAAAKVCQDIVLTLISQTSMSRNVTVKGGVVMRSISHDARRATQDIDLDFICYSLRDESIHAFIEKLNAVGAVNIRATGNIEELRQQDYHGKRVYVTIRDASGYYLSSKIDFGVHKHVDIEQEEYCFDVGIDDVGISLLINSKEQMLTEKLRSILKFGAFSTRYKDVFDIFYLFELVDNEKLTQCFNTLIFADPGMRENTVEDVVHRVESTFSNKRYLDRLKGSEKNWLGLKVSEVLSGILDHLRALK